MSDTPQISRVRHELKRRRLTVAGIEKLPANMVRIVLHGADLHDFTSLGFDDHIKLFFPSADADGKAAMAMRDFTPHHFDTAKQELWIDFYLHQAGPATAWASSAAIGQTLEIGGPKGSSIISLEGIDSHLFIGDETALPAVQRRLAELPTGSHALAVVELETHAERPTLASRAELRVVYVNRGEPDCAEPGDTPARELIQCLQTLTFPAGRCFCWIAVESHSARAIRGYLRDERKVDKHWIKAAGYWRRGTAGVHDNIADEA